MKILSPGLGAVELIELGGPAPMLAQGPEAQMGFSFSQVGVFLADALATVFNVLADIVAVPAKILVSGVDVVFENIASVLQEIPVLGDLAAQALLAAGAILKFGISVPGMLFTEIGNLFEGLSAALDTTLGEDGKSDKVKKASEEIVKRAPEPIKKEVGNLLSKTPTSGPAPKVGEGDLEAEASSPLNDTLKIAVPAALAVGAVAILAT